MDPQGIPERSSLWFGKVTRSHFRGKLLDKVTIFYALFLTAFVFIVFWPLVSQIRFEESFYTPLVPFLMGLLSVLGLDANSSLQALFMFSLVVTGLGIYLLVRDLTKRQVTAILASVLYFIPPVPIFVLTFFRRGLLYQELLSAKSFFTIIYGDGALFFALALIPFGAIFALRYLKSGLVVDLVLCVLLSGTILLSERTQSFVYFMILLLFTLTEIFLGNSALKLKRFFTIGLFSMGIVSFWYTPLFWLEGIMKAFRQMSGNIQYFFPLPFILAGISLLFSYAFFARKVERQAIFASFLIFIVFLAISISWLFSGKSIILHQHRLLPDLIMFGAVVGAISLSAFFDKLDIISRLSFEKWSSIARILGAVGFGLISFIFFSALAYLVSPAAILAVSGPYGVWTKIRMNVLADREEMLRISGGTFKLVVNTKDQFQLLIGYTVSMIFLVSLVYLVLTAILGSRKKL